MTGIDLRTLTDALHWAARTRDAQAAENFSRMISEALSTQRGDVTPIDMVRARLALVERHLYQGTAEGAQAALDALDRLEQDRDLARIAVQEPSYHVFRAAALGQLYSQARQGRDSERTQRIADEATKAIRDALVARQEDWLRYLADPHRDRSRDQDDDLVALAKDREDVRAMLGLR